MAAEEQANGRAEVEELDYVEWITSQFKSTTTSSSLGSPYMHHRSFIPLVRSVEPNKGPMMTRIHTVVSSEGLLRKFLIPDNHGNMCEHACVRGERERERCAWKHCLPRFAKNA